MRLIRSRRARCLILIFIAVVPGRERISALDDPTKSKEGSTSENSSAPSVRVPSAVLSDCKPPLISQCCRVRVNRIGWVRVLELVPRTNAAIAVAAAAAAVVGFDGDL
ncbi:hypothetical protein Ancab_033900 [Ancistrocladus abbreviatus]